MKKNAIFAFIKIAPEHLKLKFPDIEPELLEQISEFSEVKEVQSGDVLVPNSQINWSNGKFSLM